MKKTETDKAPLISNSAGGNKNHIGPSTTIHIDGLAKGIFWSSSLFAAAWVVVELIGKL